ncbi:MAG: ATP-binding protein [Paludibacter sp.]|nr:ATP-binding protein [Paludibacter sp.]
MKLDYFKQSMFKQFFVSNISVITVALICYASVDIIGYRSVALLLLATVSVLAIFFTLYPILCAATMSALIWDFFFIPPHFTFHITSSEDTLLLLMYFVIALINGVLTSKVRGLEKMELQKEERHNTIKLYKTLFDSLSHELRTPIATIVGASDNLMQKDSHVSEPDKAKLIDEISIAAFRLNRLIDNLLNMQRLESGTLKIKPDWCEVSELINSPVNRLKNELSTHNLEINIQEDFPMIKLDFGLIEQSLFNLLHNETLYTPEGSTITIDASYINDKLIIIISDNGKGFTDEELKLLFSKFYRATAKTTGGTGLGLSIVKGFVEAHNGKVRVENNTPVGAKFTIEIPCETLELEDIMDFNELTIKENIQYETLTDIYIPKGKDKQKPTETDTVNE